MWDKKGKNLTYKWFKLLNEQQMSVDPGMSVNPAMSGPQKTMASPQDLKIGRKNIDQQIKKISLTPAEGKQAVKMAQSVVGDIIYADADKQQRKIAVDGIVGPLTLTALTAVGIPKELIGDNPRDRNNHALALRNINQIRQVLSKKYDAALPHIGVDQQKSIAAAKNTKAPQVKPQAAEPVKTKVAAKTGSRDGVPKECKGMNPLKRCTSVKALAPIMQQKVASVMSTLNGLTDQIRDSKEYEVPGYEFAGFRIYETWRSHENMMAGIKRGVSKVNPTRSPSWHRFGLAVDIVPYFKDLKTGKIVNGWAVGRGKKTKEGRIARRLISGGRWKGWKVLKSVYEQNGLQTIDWDKPHGQIKRSDALAYLAKELGTDPKRRSVFVAARRRGLKTSPVPGTYRPPLHPNDFVDLYQGVA